MISRSSSQHWMCNDAAGPDWKHLIVTVLLVVAPSCAFLVFIGTDIARQVSWVIFVVMLLLFLFNLGSLTLTAFTNPGIIPRRTGAPPPEASGRPDGRRTRTWTVHGQKVKTKYCDTCNIYRPPRCNHCRRCDNCVERFDHHCPWVGTCIGRRNYRYYLFFIFSAFLLCAMVLLLCLSRVGLLIHKDKEAFFNALKQEPAAVLLFIYTAVMLVGLGSLVGYHVQLIWRNLTTYEQFKSRFSMRRKLSPYSHGVMGNCVEVCCTPMEEYKNPTAGSEGLPRIDSGVILDDPTAEGGPPHSGAPDKQPVAPEHSDPSTPTGSAGRHATQARQHRQQGQQGEPGARAAERRLRVVARMKQALLFMPTCMLPEPSLRSITTDVTRRSSESRVSGIASHINSFLSIPRPASFSQQGDWPYTPTSRHNLELTRQAAKPSMPFGPDAEQDNPSGSGRLISSFPDLGAVELSGSRSSAGGSPRRSDDGPQPAGTPATPRSGGFSDGGTQGIQGSAARSVTRSIRELLRLREDCMEADAGPAPADPGGAGLQRGSRRPPPALRRLAVGQRRQVRAEVGRWVGDQANQVAPGSARDGRGAGQTSSSAGEASSSQMGREQSHSSGESEWRTAQFAPAQGVAPHHAGALSANSKGKAPVAGPPLYAQLQAPGWAAETPTRSVLQVTRFGVEARRDAGGGYSGVGWGSDLRATSGTHAASALAHNGHSTDAQEAGLTTDMDNPFDTVGPVTGSDVRSHSSVSRLGVDSSGQTPGVGGAGQRGRVPSYGENVPSQETEWTYNGMEDNNGAQISTVGPGEVRSSPVAPGYPTATHVTAGAVGGSESTPQGSRRLPAGLRTIETIGRVPQQAMGAVGSLIRPGDSRLDLLGDVFEPGYETEHIAQQKAGGYIRFEARRASPGHVVVHLPHVASGQGSEHEGRGPERGGQATPGGVTSPTSEASSATRRVIGYVRGGLSTGLQLFRSSGAGSGHEHADRNAYEEAGKVAPPVRTEGEESVQCDEDPRQGRTQSALSTPAAGTADGVTVEPRSAPQDGTDAPFFTLEDVQSQGSEPAGRLPSDSLVVQSQPCLATVGTAAVGGSRTSVAGQAGSSSFRLGLPTHGSRTGWNSAAGQGMLHARIVEDNSPSCGCSPPAELHDALVQDPHLPGPRPATDHHYHDIVIGATNKAVPSPSGRRMKSLKSMMPGAGKKPAPHDTRRPEEGSSASGSRRLKAFDSKSVLFGGYEDLTSDIGEQIDGDWDEI